MLYAFQRFEREITYHRASAFLMRVVAIYDNVFELHERQPEEFRAWLRSLVLFEPDTQLYLLDAQGTVLGVERRGEARARLSRSRSARCARRSSMRRTPYVMGDDPERMDADAVIAAQPLRRAVIRAARRGGRLPVPRGAHAQRCRRARWATLQRELRRPALGLIGAVVALTTLLAVWIVAAVTRPLRRLTESVAAVSQAGLDATARCRRAPTRLLPPRRPRDEFGQLTTAFAPCCCACASSGRRCAGSTTSGAKA